MLTPEEQREAQIERYLSGLMSPEEQAQFESQVKSDEALKKDFNLYQQLNAAFDKEGWSTVDSSIDTSKLDQYFRSKEAQDVKEHLNQAADTYFSSNKKSGIPRYMVAAMISVLILLGGYWFMGSSRVSFDDHYLQSDMPSLVSRADGESNLKNIALSYNEGDYKAALSHYEDYLNSGVTVNEKVYLYGGMAYLQLGQSDNALIAFEKLSSSSNIDASKGLWFSALVYLKDNNVEALKKVLDEIMNDTSNFKYKEARALREKLD